MPVERRLIAGLALCLSVALAGPRLAGGLNHNAVALAVSWSVLDYARVDFAQFNLDDHSSEKTLADYGLGQVHEQQGDFGRAEQLWSGVLQTGSHQLPLIRVKASHSRPLAELASQLYPGVALCWDWLGDTWAAEAPEAALDNYLRAVQIEPGANLVWEKIGALAERLNQTEVASNAYRQACNIKAIRNGSCLSAARLAYGAGDWATVIEYYKRGGQPEQVQGWVQLITAARKLGRTDEADRYLQQAQAGYPADYLKLLGQEP